MLRYSCRSWFPLFVSFHCETRLPTTPSSVRTYLSLPFSPNLTSRIRTTLQLFVCAFPFFWPRVWTLRSQRREWGSISTCWCWAAVGEMAWDGHLRGLNIVLCMAISLQEHFFLIFLDWCLTLGFEFQACRMTCNRNRHYSMYYVHFDPFVIET